MKTYILSGGKSSRMGTDKGLVQLHQKPLISYLIETLQKLDFDIKIIAHHSDYHKFKIEECSFIIYQSIIIFMSDDLQRIPT